MSERWFFALWPDAAARRALVDGAAGVIPSDVRRSHPEDLHLTLIFLGELAPEALDAAVQAADGLCAGPVDLHIDRVGYFARPRVFWCGPAEPSPGLMDLHARLARALAQRGLITERRPYSPHITLARKVGQYPSGEWVSPVRWIARELVLAHRVEGRTPHYARWRTWALDAERPGEATETGPPDCPL